YAEPFQHTNKKEGYIEVTDHRFFDERACITWAYGHLVELVSPEQYNAAWKQWKLEQVPMFPEHFQFQVSKDKVATDGDREGENIARRIMSLAGAPNKPTTRTWSHALAVDQIQRGLQKVREGNNYLSIHKEAQTRQFSDWLVGMHAPRLDALRPQQRGMQGVFSAGRVQTATLYLL